MGSQINRELSFLLEQHIERGQLPVETRLINARAFQRDAASKMKGMAARLEQGGGLEE